MRVFVNGIFHSCEEDNRTFSVLVEQGGKIVYTGDEVPARYAKKRCVDLAGQTAVPAFADTHLHFESYAVFLSTVDVRDAADFDEMGQLLRAYTAAHPRERFLVAFGCCANTVKEKRLPNRTDLDGMLSIPLLLVKYDGHAAVANTALMRQFPEAVRQEEGFDEESGWLYQNAFYKGVNYITAKVSPLRMLRGMQKASAQLARAGVGYLHTVEGVGYKNDLDVDTLRMVRGILPQYFKIFFQTTDVEKVTKRKLKQIGGCFKLALDGCFGSEDAALTEGYTNNPDNKGFLLYSQQEIDAFCIRANRAGLQIAVHAIGDAAVEQALNAFDAALSDTPRSDHRHIIIHADLIPQALIERAARLQICIALQPNFLRWKQEPAEYLEHILGKRAQEMLPLRSLIDAGILISAGSDAPCTVPDPIASIYNCCNHPTQAQSVTPLEALKMHTLWAARMGFDEKYRGSLTPGKVADFTVLSGDPLKTPVDKLQSLRVTAMYIKGRKIGSV